MSELNEKINVTREIHKKVWGSEDWIANDGNAGYCGKRLLLNRGYQCSMHMHKIKSETFYVNEGFVLMQAYGDEILMKPGDSLEIVPGTYHRFIGITNAEIFESSSFHKDEDSYREEISSKVSDEIFQKYLVQYASAIIDFKE